MSRIDTVIAAFAAAVIALCVLVLWGAQAHGQSPIEDYLRAKIAERNAQAATVDVLQGYDMRDRYNGTVTVADAPYLVPPAGQAILAPYPMGIVGPGRLGTSNWAGISGVQMSAPFQPLPTLDFRGLTPSLRVGNTIFME